MQRRKALKKGMLIVLMSASLLFSFTSISLAEESGQMGGMNMDTHESQSTENSMSEHEATPDMDPNMEGMIESDKGGEHGEEESQGHEEKGETSEEVNWVVVGGFLALNAMIILSAAISKHSNKVQPQQ